MNLFSLCVRTEGRRAVGPPIPHQNPFLAIDLIARQQDILCFLRSPMIYPDMMHNQFKRKLDFLPLFPEMTHAVSMHLNLIKWLQQRQFGRQLLPSVVLIEERQLLKSHSLHLPFCTCSWFEVINILHVCFKYVNKEPFCRNYLYYQSPWIHFLNNCGCKL